MSEIDYAAEAASGIITSVRDFGSIVEVRLGNEAGESRAVRFDRSAFRFMVRAEKFNLLGRYATVVGEPYGQSITFDD